MPSGKQVLLYFLQKYALKKQKKQDLKEASENLRVAFLLHGSTPKEMWHTVDSIEWGEEIADNSSKVLRQGLKIQNKDIFLDEIFEYMTWNADEKIPEEVSTKYPDLSQSEFYFATRIMSLIFSSIEWSDLFSEVEDNGELDFNKLESYLKSVRKKLNLFREDPENYF